MWEGGGDDKDNLREKINRLIPKSAQKLKFKKNPKFHFVKYWKTKWYHAKVLPKRFYLNGHTTRFHPQTQKLELCCMSPYLTLGGKGGSGEVLLTKSVVEASAHF